VTEDVRLRVRTKLEELLGVDGAEYLLDRPPGGWSDLVTKSYLDEFGRQLEERLELRLSSKIDRAFATQTWRLFGAMTAFAGVLVAAVKL
jgi:hypothetical protein